MHPYTKQQYALFVVIPTPTPSSVNSFQQSTPSHESPWHKRHVILRVTATARHKETKVSSILTRMFFWKVIAGVAVRTCTDPVVRLQCCQGQVDVWGWSMQSSTHTGRGWRLASPLKIQQTFIYTWRCSIKHALESTHTEGEDVEMQM